jgi:hypothetical protein
MNGATSTRRPHPEGGFAIVVVLLLLVIAAAISVDFAGRFSAVMRDRGTSRASTAALYAAQGGVERARAALARDASWTGEDLVVGDAVASVRVAAVEGATDLRRVEVVGVAPAKAQANFRAQRRIDAVVRLGPGLPRVVGWREDGVSGAR